ncbi:MAG TPA: hypothetical protein VEI95_04945 [Acidobacteriota bacterium]|nr:hypothetical protein [Acidobacteriota bacterium]
MRLLPTILLPSIGNMVFVALLVVLVFGTGNGILNDGDTGYHIRTGEVILKTGRVPTKDIYSSHVPALKWTAHEWLAEVIMAVVFKATGLTGLVLFFALLLAATHWLLYRVLRSQSESCILVILITLLATTTSSSHWLARPHVFSLLITLVWVHLLDQFQYRNQHTLKFLPWIMLLWVNLHGGFFIGIVLLVVYITGNILHSFAGYPNQARQHRRKAKILSCYLILTLVASLINPIGAKILLFPIKLTSDRFIMDRVIEFLSPNFHDVLPFKYMLLATICVLALSQVSLNLIETGLILLLSYMALYSARHVSLYAIIVAPLLLKSCESVLRNLPTQLFNFIRLRDQNLSAIDAKISGYFWPSFSIILIVSLALVGNLQFQFNEKRFPVAAVEFIMRENITGKMFNNDEFGDYIIFSAWPRYRVFMDGRSDMYGEKLGAPYLKVANVQPGWKDVLSQYNIDWIIFDTDSALSAALREQNDWHAVYSDQVATIFIKKNVEHKYLTAKYPTATLPTTK